MTMRFQRSARLALVCAVVALLGAGLGFRAAVGQLNIYLRKEPVALRGPLATIPVTLGAWQQRGADRVLSDAIVEELGTRQYLDRTYVRAADGGDPPLVVHLAYYTGLIDAIPHVPDRCWVAGGLVRVGEARTIDLALDMERWPQTSIENRATGEPYRVADVVDPILGIAESVHMPIGRYALRALEFQSQTQPDERLIGGYAFIANGRITPSALDVRRLAFDASERYAYFLKIQFAMPTRADDPDRWDRYRVLVEEFLDELLPQVMRRLPDWPTVEAGGATPPPQ